MQQDSCLSLNPNIHEDSSILNIDTGYYVKLYHQVSPPLFFARQINKSTGLFDIGAEDKKSGFGIMGPTWIHDSLTYTVSQVPC